ncbi:MAG: tetratricopeptide repeat protein [Chromatiales bacterium]|nr:tetratricopeptide repeat protein [Chromatiales bacterium]
MDVLDVVSRRFVGQSSRRSVISSRLGACLASLLFVSILTLVTACNKPGESAADSGDATPSQPSLTTRLDAAIARHAAGDFAAALEALTPLAEQGSAEAQARLGAMYERGEGVTRSFETAHAWYRKAAEQNHAQAQYALATLYAYGYGVRQDYGQAAIWADRARENGYGAEPAADGDQAAETKP